MQLRLKPGNITPGLSVVHPELDFVYFMAQIPQSLFSDVTVSIYQRLVIISLITI
jgi:hypothetical protein